MRLLIVFGLVALLSGAALADESARLLRVEAAALIQAAETAEPGRQRQALLEEALGKLLAIQDRYPTETARVSLYLGGKRISLTPASLRARMSSERSTNVDAGTLREVLGRPLSPTAADENGWTDLHWAAALDLPELAEALLDAGADIEARIEGDGTASSEKLKRSLEALQLGVHTIRGHKSWVRSGHPLHVAAFYGAADVVAALVARGAEIDARDIRGKTPLHIAAYTNAVEVARALIVAGADIEARDDDGMTALRVATSSAHVFGLAVVETLIAAGADVGGSSGESLLHSTHYGDVAEALIRAGADVNAKDSYGGTPLYDSRTVEKTEALIKAGADVNARNEAGQTPLHWGVMDPVVYRRDVVEALIAGGADVNAKSSYGETALRLAVRCGNGCGDAVAVLVAGGADVLAEDDDGWTPLHLAAQENAASAATALIAGGADIDAKDKLGMTALHVAAGENADWAALSLIAGGADIRVENNDGDTPLMIAERKNAQKVIALFRERQAAIRPRFPQLDVGRLRAVLGRALSPIPAEEDSWTDLHWAAALGLPELALALMDAGADVDARSGSATDRLERSLAALQLKQPIAYMHVPIAYRGMMPLHAAAITNSREVAAILISAGADVNARTLGFRQRPTGATPLHLAAKVDAAATAAMLLEAGADVDAELRHLGTPLHVAASYGAADVAAVLVSAGAEVDAKNGDGQTPLETVGYRFVSRDLIEVLTSHGLSHPTQ